MADFTTQGTFISTEYNATNVVIGSQPTQLLSEDSYSISGGIVNVTSTKDLVVGSQPSQLVSVDSYSISGGIVNVTRTVGLVHLSNSLYLDNSIRRDTSGPTISLELGLFITIGSGGTNLPTSGLIWPV